MQLLFAPTNYNPKLEEKYRNPMPVFVETTNGDNLVPHR
tara:strand:+ start:461 stop:577 length:117 start_codon:yes stop_codon:yes gene_type:complete